MARLVAMTDFQHPTRGQVLRNEIWDEDDSAIEAKLRLDDTALYARKGMEVRHMRKVKALENAEVPSTKDLFIKGQVAGLDDKDAEELIAAGKARDAHDDEKVTRDVGKLRESDDAALPKPRGEED